MSVSRASAPTSHVSCLLTQSSQQPFQVPLYIPIFQMRKVGPGAVISFADVTSKEKGLGLKLGSLAPASPAPPTCPSPGQQCDRMENIEQNFQAPQESTQSCTHSPDSVKTLLSASFHVGIISCWHHQSIQPILQHQNDQAGVGQDWPQAETRPPQFHVDSGCHGSYSIFIQGAVVFPLSSSDSEKEMRSGTENF